MSLEIETVSTFRGPLAERLVKLAEQQGRPPVEVLADIVQHGLIEPTRPERVAELIDLRAQVKQLRKKYESVRDRVVKLSFLPAVQTKLLAEARARDWELDDLVYEIVVAVAEDNLFTAVLEK